MTVDEELVAAASAAVTAAYRPGWHFVGAAVRTSSGDVHVGVNLQAYVSRISVCAEPIAVGQAVLGGGHDIARAVAVYRPSADAAPVVCSPCGMCRELLGDYGDEVEVIVPGADGPVAVPLASLLPNRYRREPA